MYPRVGCTSGAHDGLPIPPWLAADGDAIDGMVIEPRTLSFKGAVQTLEAFQPVLAGLGDPDVELGTV